MNDKQQLAAMGENITEQAAQPMCMAKRIEELVERAERAERSLTRAGFTYTEGAQEWKPPIGPSALPLLERIDRLTFLLRELRDGTEGEWCFPGNLDERIDAALAGKMPSTNSVAGVDWSSFPGWLIDHHEGDIITEEMLQFALADMLAAAPSPDSAK